MFRDGVAEVGGGIGGGVVNAGMDEYDEASSATGRAVSALNRVLAKVWVRGTGCEFRLLNACDQDFVLGEKIVNLLT